MWRQAQQSVDIAGRNPKSDPCYDSCTALLHACTPLLLQLLQQGPATTDNSDLTLATTQLRCGDRQSSRLILQVATLWTTPAMFLLCPCYDPCLHSAQLFRPSTPALLQGSAMTPCHNCYPYYIYDPCHLRLQCYILGMAMQMREYAVHADYTHIRKYLYLPKIAICWAKNGSAWLCIQF